LQLEILNRGPADAPADPRVAELLRRIQAGRDLPSDERRKLLQGIVDLYRGQDWSRAVVDKAQQELAELERS
jgi:hypothetical protein